MKKRFCELERTLGAAMFVFLLAIPSWAAITVAVGTDPSKQILKGKIVTPDQILDGEVVIEGETITCVAVDCDDPAGATVFSIALDMNGAPATGVLFTGTNLETRFRAALLNKAGAEVVSKQDFGIGDLSITL